MTQHKRIQRYRRKKRSLRDLRGTAEKPRLVVFRSLRAIEAQLIDDENGKTLVGLSSRTEENGANIAAAKKIGEKMAAAAQKKKINTCLFDRNGYTYHGKVKAVAEGAREGGLQF